MRRLHSKQCRCAAPLTAHNILLSRRLSLPGEPGARSRPLGAAPFFIQGCPFLDETRATQDPRQIGFVCHNNVKVGNNATIGTERAVGARCRQPVRKSASPAVF